MTHLQWTLPLIEELDRWQEAGRVAPFWLRDDDAVAPSEPLDRLLQATGSRDLPVLLAVIPARTEEALAERLSREPQAAVAVHGWSHENHAGTGEKKQELGRHRPTHLVLDELRLAFSKLSTLHAVRFTPVLAPPWNRIDAGIVAGLPALGYRALSVYGPEKQASLPMVNTHVDVIDWHGGKGCRDPALLAAEIVARLRFILDHGGTMGLLTHHLVHDEAVWRFLDGLFDMTAGHPACRWMAVADLIAPPEKGGRTAVYRSTT